jgi:hypothetical protein
MLDAKTGADGTSDTNQFLNHAHRRHQATFFLESADFGTSPFFGQDLVKLISSTVGQRTIPENLHRKRLMHRTRNRGGRMIVSMMPNGYQRWAVQVDWEYFEEHMHHRLIRFVEDRVVDVA